MTSIQDTMPQRISMGIDLTGRVEKCEGYYVSLCNELPLIGMGATPEEAMISFMECFEEYIRLSVEWGVTRWRRITASISAGLLSASRLTIPLHGVCPEWWTWNLRIRWKRPRWPKGIFRDSHYSPSGRIGRIRV